MKTCFKCRRDLPRSEFYRHAQMKDGLLGKCKDCTKADAAAREAEKAKDPAWRIAERKRHRRKSRQYRADGRAKPQVGNRPEPDPVKRKARIAVDNAIRDGRLIPQPCERCGADETQGHHEDYSKPLEVNWLCVPCHAARHVELRNLADLTA